MKKVKFASMVLVMVACFAQGANAYTVAGFNNGGFADFSKAIVFTGVACPVNGETIATTAGAKTCALPMKPVGDGSWVCTATMFPGTAYSYYFEYRIPKFDSTTVHTDSQLTYAWRNVSATGARTQDATRDIMAPAVATSGYVLYNIFGDKTVTGAQGMGKAGSWDTELTIANPNVSQYLGSTKVSTSGDADTMNMDGATGATNAFGISIAQLDTDKVRIGWAFGADFVPSVEGGREFDTLSTYTPYGFRILRARVGATGSTSPIQQYLKFEDTVGWQVRGYTFYSPHRDSQGIGWYNGENYFVDTSLPGNTAVGDSFVYTVLWTDAYGLANDSSDQNFGNGSVGFTRQNQVDFIFLVEKFDYNVVFPNGATEGNLYLTPYVNGIPNPFKKVKTRAFLFSPKAKAQG